ncbi:hypothetical protein GYH30_031487 [Glycine max]|nr:hypothetical protein GYH30_031487 [Glycine max]
MKGITEGVNNINIADSYKKNRIQVSNTMNPLLQDIGFDLCFSKRELPLPHLFPTLLPSYRFARDLLLFASFVA